MCQVNVISSVVQSFSFVMTTKSNFLHTKKASSLILISFFKSSLFFNTFLLCWVIAAYLCWLSRVSIQVGQKFYIYKSWQVRYWFFVSANKSLQINKSLPVYPLVGELQTESSFEKSRQCQQYNLFVKELPLIQEYFFCNFQN